MMSTEDGNPADRRQGSVALPKAAPATSTQPPLDGGFERWWERYEDVREHDKDRRKKDCCS